jgi:acetoin utilization deacetylase AcuC-like enzyme
VRQAVEAVAAQGPGAIGRLDGDTTLSAASFEAALASVEGAREAVRRVADGRWTNAFVLARPPGHHAERAQALGFCLFNNAAVAAREAQQAGLARVAILDWDVHHGNGTQHLFEEDSTVFYASLHQWPLYPGTGRRGERGRGAGEGTTLNVPMEVGSGDREWLGALEELVLPALEAFAPDVLLVSAGFDAHADDPLAGCRVTTDGFARMTALARGLADARCEGRLVSLLEGGYDLAALAASVEAHVAGLR